MKRLFFLLFVATMLLSPLLDGMDFNTWETCLATAGRQDCVLTPGSYTINQTLVLAAGVKISGGGVLPSSTLLTRDLNFTGTLISVPVGISASIENLKVNGNRTDQYQCPSANLTSYEIVVSGYATISGVDFEDSRGSSLVLSNGSVVNSSFYNSRSTGMWIYQGQVSNSDFEYNGTAAINAAGTGTKTISGNYFYMNRYEMPDGSGGGQVYINFDAANTLVTNNTIDGAGWVIPSYYTTSTNGCPLTAYGQRVFGIEVEPRSSQNQIYTNEIIGHTASGIVANAVYGLTISGYDRVACPYTYCSPRYIHDNLTTPWSSGGIEILYHYIDPNTLQDYYTSGLVLDSILSRYNTGVAVNVEQGSAGSGWTGNHCLYYGYNTSTNLTNQYPATTTSCP